MCSPFLFFLSIYIQLTSCFRTDYSNWSPQNNVLISRSMSVASPEHKGNSGIGSEFSEIRNDGQPKVRRRS